jgi:hypothetical protein
MLVVYPLGFVEGYAPRLVNAAAADVAPVPPLATGRAVPEYVRANVPLVVMGEPDTLKNDGTVAATLVTVPFLESLDVIVKFG